MDFIQDKRCNDVLAAPSGVTIEQCRALPIRRCQYEDGTPAVQSFWKPSETELHLLKAGAPVILTILGHTHPPLTVGV